MVVDSFLLMSGEDIPLLESNILIHHPTIKELVNVFLNEEKFFTAYEFLFFSKDSLPREEYVYLKDVSNFEILLTLLNSIDKTLMAEQLDCLKNFLELLFKEYTVNFEKESIVLSKDKYLFFIKEQEFEQLKKIVKQMFPLKTKDTGLEYNPQGGRAREIAEKLKKAKQKLEKQNKQLQLSLIERYISILSIGLQIPADYFQKYTVYQLINNFNRYEKKEAYDVHLKAQLAGATGMKEVDHWMM